MGSSVGGLDGMFTWYAGEGLSLGRRFDRRLSLRLAFVNTSALGSFDFAISRRVMSERSGS